MDDATDDDALLLRRLADGDRDAFAAIVRRHLDFVYATARRRVGGDAHLAEDVAQAVFVILSQKAAWLGGRVVLVGWLYRTVGHVASNAVRMRRRRERYERNAAAERTEHAMPTDEAADEETLARLDAAIHALRAHSRDAILLRFFRRLTFAEVGRALGIGDAAAKKRVARAVDELRGVLAAGGAGAATIAATLAALEATPAAAAAPAALAGTILNANAPSAAAAALSKGTLIAMSTKKIAAAAAALVAVTAGGIGAVAVLAPRDGSKSVPTPTPPALSFAAVAVSATTAPAGDEDDGALVAMLPDGMFTLLAVGDPDAGPFWSPSGRGEVPRPFDQFPGPRGRPAPPRDLDPGQIERVFVLRNDVVRSRAEPVFLTPRIAGTPPGIVAIINPSGVDGEALICMIGRLEAKTPATVRISLGRNWRTVARCVPGPKTVPFDDATLSLQPLTALADGGGTEVRVRFEDYSEDQRVVVTTGPGKDVVATLRTAPPMPPAEGQAAGKRPWDATFWVPEVKPEAITEVRVERQPIDQVVEFRDVAISPDAPTTPSVVVQSRDSEAVPDVNIREQR